MATEERVGLLLAVRGRMDIMAAAAATMLRRKAAHAPARKRTLPNNRLRRHSASASTRAMLHAVVACLVLALCGAGVRADSTSGSENKDIVENAMNARKAHAAEVLKVSSSGSNSSGGGATEWVLSVNGNGDAVATKKIATASDVQITWPPTASAESTTLAVSLQRLTQEAASIGAVRVMVMMEPKTDHLKFDDNSNGRIQLVFPTSALANTTISTLTMDGVNAVFDSSEWLPASLTSFELLNSHASKFRLPTNFTTKSTKIMNSHFDSIQGADLAVASKSDQFHFVNNTVEQQPIFSPTDMASLNNSNSTGERSGNIVAGDRSSCKESQPLWGMRICVESFGAISDALPVGNSPAPPVARPSSNSPTTSKPDDSRSGTARQTSSNKTLGTVTVVVGVCCVLLVIAAFVFVRQRKKQNQLDERFSLMHPHTGLLTAPATQDGTIKASSNATLLGEMQLGNEDVSTKKKLGINGLWTAEYQGTPVVAMRINPRAGDTSIKQLNAKLNQFIPLKHPNVVQFLGIGRTPLDEYLVVVENMECGSLRTVLADAQVKLTWEQRLKMAIDIASGVEFMHKQPTALHAKKFTAATVLCAADFTCKLDVFEYAPSLRDSSSPLLSFGFNEIASRAPELLNGGAPTMASDVYALGVLLCELSTRLPAYNDILSQKGSTIGDLMIAREVRGNRLRPKPAEDAPTGYQEVINRCVAFAPNARPSASEVVRALKACNS